MKWSSLIPSCFRTPPPSPSTATVYQVWPGNNVFFLDGRAICGPDPRGLILTVISVAIPELAFIFDIAATSSEHPILKAAISMALAASVIVTLMLTATRDPGIIPRSRTSPSQEAGTGSTATATARRTRTVVVDGVEMKQKYCRVCGMFREPRSAHCDVCDNCVDKFDHHCPLIGQCIGLRNYRFYLLLITLALVFYTYMFAFSARRVRVKLGEAAGSGVLSLLRTSPEMLALAVLSFMAVCMLACFLAFHGFLIAKNQTSHEMQRGRYRSSHNPYDRGVLRNIKACLFEKLPPPRVDFRAMAEPSLLGSAARTASHLLQDGATTT